MSARTWHAVAPVAGGTVTRIFTHPDPRIMIGLSLLIYSLFLLAVLVAYEGAHAAWRWWR